MTVLREAQGKRLSGVSSTSCMKRIAGTTSGRHSSEEAFIRICGEKDLGILNQETGAIFLICALKGQMSRQKGQVLNQQQRKKTLYLLEKQGKRAERADLFYFKKMRV